MSSESSPSPHGGDNRKSGHPAHSQNSDPLSSHAAPRVTGQVWLLSPREPCWSRHLFLHQRHDGGVTHVTRTLTTEETPEAASAGLNVFDRAVAQPGRFSVFIQIQELHTRPQIRPPGEGMRTRTGRCSELTDAVFPSMRLNRKRTM